MTSILSMMINSVISACMYLLRAVFSLLKWFLRSFGRLLKLFYVILPVTSIIFVLLMALSVFILCSDTALFSSVFLNEAAQSAEELSASGSRMTISMFSELKKWWDDSLNSYRGTPSYALLIFLMILMFVPVMTVFLSLSVFASFGRFVFLSVVADAGIYLFRAVLGKTFVAQAMNRYYRFAPDAGRRHAQKEYDRMMRNRNRELEEEERARKKRRHEDFYEDPGYAYENERLDDDETYYEDDCFEDDEFYEDEHFEDDGFYEDERFEDDEFYEDEHFEDDEFYEDEHFEDDRYKYRENDTEYEDNEASEENYEYDGFGEYYEEYSDDSRNIASGSAGTFNFFVGCSSRESVDKKYKSLVKLYHPDNMDGDTAALQEINAQYAEAKKRFG